MSGLGTDPGSRDQVAVVLSLVAFALEEMPATTPARRPCLIATTPARPALLAALSRGSAGVQKHA
eukprot:1351906-Rhodomonas_salina.1